MWCLDGGSQIRESGVASGGTGRGGGERLEVTNGSCRPRQRAGGAPWWLEVGAALGTRLRWQQRREQGAHMHFGRPLSGEARLPLNEGSRLV